MEPRRIRERFLGNAEEKFREFSERIVVPKDHSVIGIRMPVIKEFAKDICKGDWRAYLDETCDIYHEDVMLRGLIIARADTETDRMIKEFVPVIDNWAICDSFSSALKVNKNNRNSMWELILPYLDTDDEFQIRFAVVMMLFHFIDEEHIDDVIMHMNNIRHDAYYVKMGVAWCLSVCFIKFQDKTMRYLKNNTLDKFTFNKTLSKITDSFRVSSEVKEEIRTMRRK